MTIYILLFFLHTIISLSIGQWLYSRFSVDHEQAQVWRLLGILFSFFMPVYGAIGIFIIYLVLKHKSKTRKRTETDHLDHHMVKDRISAKAEDTTLIGIDWQEEKEIQPLVDALSDIDHELRKGAVVALAEKRDPQSIKVLADSLENTVLEVRYYAVEALAKISKSYADRIIELQDKLEKNPASVENIVELANCYFEYATSNVEDENLSEYYLTHARDQLQKALKIKSDDAKLLLKYGDILTRMDKYEDALKVLNKVLTFDQKNIDVLIRLADIHFKMGSIKEVKIITKRIRFLYTKIPNEIQQAINVWQ